MSLSEFATGEVFTFPALADAIQRLTPPTAEPAAPTAPRPPEGIRDPFTTSGSGPGVWDLFSRATWAEVLEPAGWARVASPDRATEEAWQRPGASHPVSAKVLTANPHVLVVHSEDAGLPTGGGQRLTKGRVYAHLHYGGDASEASKAVLAGTAPYVPQSVALALPAAVTVGLGPTVATDAAGGDPEPAPMPATWAPVDPGPFLDGSYTPPVPSLLTRTDGVSLLYPGETHSFHGESESFKSYLLQYLCAELVRQGRPVLFIDHESDPASVIDRLLQLGATPEAIREHFTYVRPEIAPTGNAAEAAAWLALLDRRYALAVVDGVTDSLGVFGLSTKDNDDVTRWSRMLPRRIADRTGAAVVVVDHVTKDADTRGRFAIGGQAKLSGLTGAAYTVEVVKAVGRGLCGEVVLRVGKDRPGYVRGHSGPMRAGDRTQEAARITVDSREAGSTVVTVNPWRPATGSTVDGEAFRPTALMERASRALEDAPGPLTTNALNATVGGKERYVAAALGLLVTEGYVKRVDGPNRSLRHTSLRPYRQTSDPASDLFVSA